MCDIYRLPMTNTAVPITFLKMPHDHIHYNNVYDHGAWLYMYYVIKKQIVIFIVTGRQCQAQGTVVVVYHVLRLTIMNTITNILSFICDHIYRSVICEDCVG